MLWGLIWYRWRADCSGLTCLSVTGSLGSLVVQEGEPGASSCWLSSLALGSSWLLSSGDGSGPQDMDFRNPECSRAWGRVVVHVQEPGSLGILCAPS